MIGLTIIFIIVAVTVFIWSIQEQVKHDHVVTIKGILGSLFIALFPISAWFIFMFIIGSGLEWLWKNTGNITIYKSNVR